MDGNKFGDHEFGFKHVESQWDIQKEMLCRHLDILSCSSERGVYTDTQVWKSIGKKLLKSRDDRWDCHRQICKWTTENAYDKV